MPNLLRCPLQCCAKLIELEERYTFTVTERDYDASFRCEVTVLDEAYLEQCAAILAEQGVELTEEQRTAEQKLYSVVMSVESGEKEALPEDETMTFSAARSMLRAAASGKPHLSADAQWIEGLDGSYQYITKDTYDRVMQWYYEKEISWTEVNRYWTSIGPKGWNEYYTANILDSDGTATGATRLYQGFDLTDGARETNSEWCGKTVYFRVRGSGGTGTAIDIPAYTELATDENGDYIEAASGTRYKRAITFLNAYVPDAQSMYKSFLSYDLYGSRAEILGGCKWQPFQCCDGERPDGHSDKYRSWRRLVPRCARIQSHQECDDDFQCARLDV